MYKDENQRKGQNEREQNTTDRNIESVSLLSMNEINKRWYNKNMFGSFGMHFQNCAIDFLMLWRF